MFDCIGGEVTVDRLVECFYARMDALSEAQTIRAMHARDLGRTKDILKWYLAEWLGGPKRYSAERGHPRLRGRHIEFKIGEADTAVRLKILGALEPMANWMRNDPGNPHDRERRNS